MAKNLFISSFSKRKLMTLLMLNRAFFVFLAFFLLTQLLSLQVASITKDGSKQIVQYKRQWARDNDFIKGEKDKDLVFFLGDSRVAAGIIPKIFDEENRYSTYSYNLALPALPLTSHYFLLKDYLKKNKPPQYIVMTLSMGGFKDPLFPIYSVQGAGLLEVLQYTFLSKNIGLLLNYAIPMKFYHPELKRYFEGKILRLRSKKTRGSHRDNYYRNFFDKETYHHNWKYFYESQYIYPEETMEQRKKSLKKNRGYYFIIEQAAINGRLPDDYIAKINIEARNKENEEREIREEIYDPFVDKFFDLAQKKNIKVILVSDYRITDQVKQLQSIPEKWRYLKEKYKNVYFLNDGFKIKFYHPRYFSDPVHLTPEGADSYTREIAEEFRKIINNIEKYRKS